MLKAAVITLTFFQHDLEDRFCIAFVKDRLTRLAVMADLCFDLDSSTIVYQLFFLFHYFSMKLNKSDSSDNV